MTATAPAQYTPLAWAKPAEKGRQACLVTGYEIRAVVYTQAMLDLFQSYCEARGLTMRVNDRADGVEVICKRA